MISRSVTRALTLLAVWLLYACGNVPTAPDPERATPRGEAEPVASSEATGTADRAPVADALLGWALEPREATTDHDARIARAILDLTDDRKEIRP